eukprot:96225-Rhodomonas_salina.2
MFAAFAGDGCPPPWRGGCARAKFRRQLCRFLPVVPGYPIPVPGYGFPRLAAGFVMYESYAVPAGVLVVLVLVVSIAL